MIDIETKKEIIELLNNYSVLYAESKQKGNTEMIDYAEGVDYGISYILEKLGYKTVYEFDKDHMIIYSDIVTIGEEASK